MKRLGGVSFALDDPDELCNYMLHNINLIADDMCSIKNFNIIKHKDPWITPELLELIRDKDRALKKAKRTRSDNDWHISKRLQNSCFSRIRKAKGDRFKSELDTNKSDSKKFWKSIHELIPKNSKNKNKSELINQKNNQQISESDSATFINNFFSNIGPKVTKDFDQEWHYEGLTAEHLLGNIDEITLLCTKIDTSKAACVHNLSSTLINAFLALNTQLVFLTNSIFKTGIFPEE